MKELLCYKNLLFGNSPYVKLKYLLTVGFIILLLCPASGTFGYGKNDLLYKNSPDTTRLNFKIAKAYGIDAFWKIKDIEYTFNINFNGKVFQRRWKWYPKTKDITYWGKDSTGKDETISYNQNKIKDDKTKKTDAAFINDNYWLLFPFHLVWDDNIEFKDAGIKNYPISKGKGRCLIVTYSSKVGYTPGDVFELYLDKDNKIHEWIYKHGGSTKNPFSATWEGNKSFNGVTISTEHNGKDKKFKLLLDNINVEYEK